MDVKAFIPMLLIVLPTAAGYFARRTGLVRERQSKPLMTVVMAAGYPSVALFSIWGMQLRLADMWLPALGSVYLLLMAAAGLLWGRLVTRDRAEIGLVGNSSAMGNTGITMGGLIVYALFGEQGLALASIYCLMWGPAVVLVTYPIARHFSGARPTRSLGRLMLRSIFDFRSISLPVSVVAICLSAKGVPRPEWVQTFGVVEILVFLVTATAYFSIGLRLHVAKVPSLGKLIASIAAARFVLGAAVGWMLAAATLLTAQPLTGMARKVFLIESFVPMAVTNVAVADMFGLKPRTASVLFVANTLIYLLCVLPIVLWLFGE